MTGGDRKVAMVLALARLEGAAELGGADLAAVEDAAAAIGREVSTVEQPWGSAVALGWPTACDPEPLARRFTRRELSESAVRTFLAAYAMLTDPATPDVTAVAIVDVSARCALLFGPSTHTVSALRRTLQVAHLLTEANPGELALGPAALAWDRYDLERMEAAATRLRTSALWRGEDV
ncbi:hypothetical protein [Longispora albida]|uniref:hypothetical protein n=1 Tax=Longispora albida TaxID=203523 RepID=UPI000368EDA4|nr:hypothetical protein [Longispora albida]